MAIILMIISLCTLLIYIFINNAAQFVQSTYTWTTEEIFERGNSLFILFFVIVAPLGVSYLFDQHFTRRLFQTTYDYFADKCREEDAQYINRLKNQEVSKHAAKHFTSEKYKPHPTSPISNTTLQ